ncbi:FAS1 domain-containing protein [Haematococcus lacustris]
MANLTYATEAAKLAGLGDDLTSKLSTVFVPSDEALAAYAASNPSIVTALSTSDGAAAVTAHVVPNSALTAADIPEGESTYNTVAGTSLLVSKTGGKVVVTSGMASANVIQSDISTGNAIIHIIDNVLAPVA